MILLRIPLTAWLIYLAYGETGPITAFLLFCSAMNAEMVAALIKQSRLIREQREKENQAEE